MSNEPTEEQDLFFDETMAKLTEVAALATEAIAALNAGDFDSASHLMESKTARIWETLTSDVRELGAISDAIEKEEV